MGQGGRRYGIRGKTVLITGPARGIGAETARQLAAKGANLALAGLEPERLGALADRLGPNAAWFEADVRQADQLEKAVAGAVERFGGIEVVVANGGPGATDRRGRGAADGRVRAHPVMAAPGRLNASMDSNGRTVLTTGANSGIGLATTIELAKRGFRSVGSVRSGAKARQVRKAARQAGVEVETVLLDVTDAAACRRVMQRVKPWGLVNNAGSSFSGAIEDVGDAEARAALETMVIAPMRLARLGIPLMRAAGEGRIVNISSIYGRTTTPLTGWYQGAKHAVEGLSDALRMEVASDGIKVILIEPGSIDTGIWDSAGQELETRDRSRYAAAYRRTQQGIDLTRRFMAGPGKVAKVVARSLTVRSPRSRYLVGYDAELAARVTAVMPDAVKDQILRRTLGL